MTEAKLEALLAERIEALNLAGVKIMCTFGVADEGTGANVEEPGDEAFIDIIPENRSQETWEMPVYDFPLTVRLESRIECDKTGAAHFARADALASLLGLYCGRSGAANARGDFSIAGEFTPHFVSLGGGDNETDRDGGFRRWSQTITLRGTTN